MQICIAGAGIAGCVAGLLLARQGHDVEVLEAVEAPAALGVGINLLPHAVTILEKLDLVGKLEGLGIATRELIYFNKHGQRIWGEPRGRFAGYDVPQISIHRGALHQTLLTELTVRIGAARVRHGHRLIGTTSGSRPRASFSRPDGTTITIDADLVIGADGIHSALRRQRYPDEGLPRFGGRILWRATSRARPFLGGASMIMAGHQDCKFVAYPIDHPDAEGLQTINWIAELPRTEMLERENWNKPGDKADFAAAFAQWSFDWLDIPRLIADAPEVFEFPLVDRDPLPRWSFGATTLLGDAAHPMYPIGSNGASQAILDADALAAALIGRSDPIAALAEYEQARLPATAAVTLANRRNGPEQCMQIAEERAPNGFDRIEDVFEPGELEGIAARYKTLAGFSRNALSPPVELRA